VVKAIKDLKIDKAAGPSGICYAHLKEFDSE
jgi:hypothetical protein